MSTVPRIVGTRLLQAVPLLIATVVVNFAIIHLAPGDPVTMMVGEGAVSADQMEALRESLGLNNPLHIQFLDYLTSVLQGDLGTSYVYHQPVSEIIASRIPATLLLMGSTYLLSTFLGLLFGIVAALRPSSLQDRVLMTIAILGYSVPTFWLGFIALMIFAVELGWLPISGMVESGLEPGSWEYWKSVLHHLVLPVAVLSLFYTGLIARLMRTSMLNSLRGDFIVTARAMGLSNWRIVLRHAVPNAITPIVTVLGLQIGLMLSGAVLTETVFGWPGLGVLTVQAVAQRDYPLLLGMFLLTSVMVIIANVLTDLVYLAINPRLRSNG
ncbi:ABC transporter permease [Aminobacter anthyllidis]|uniref:ABC transporter permease n=1 Tax=Aminobacter anthyllidis TaxID=1035067 RepID=A0A9X1D6M7_9HYPH|nr:ABC transporter permease [Aminobacter anthyllidis]MBT1157231.1 ABC transporter permease [Aminobacter anthyllidis]